MQTCSQLSSAASLMLELRLHSPLSLHLHRTHRLTGEAWQKLAVLASEAQTLHNLKNRTDDVNNYLILIGNRVEDERRWQANIGDERGLLMLMALNCVCEIKEFYSAPSMKFQYLKLLWKECLPCSRRELSILARLWSLHDDGDGARGWIYILFAASRAQKLNEIRSSIMRGLSANLLNRITLCALACVGKGCVGSLTMIFSPPSSCARELSRRDCEGRN